MEVFSAVGAVHDGAMGDSRHGAGCLVANGQGLADLALLEDVEDSGEEVAEAYPRPVQLDDALDEHDDCYNAAGETCGEDRAAFFKWYG